MRDNAFGRLVGVVGSPTRTFKAIAKRPTWLAPLLILVVLGTANLAVLAPKIDWRGTITTKLERSQRQLPPERIDAVVGFLDDYGVSLTLAWSVVAPWILVPFVAFVFFHIFRRMGSALSFPASLGVLAHGLVPAGVASLLGIPMLAASDSVNLYKTTRLAPSLAAFASDDTSLELWLLLNSLDLISLWMLVLLVIGYSIAAEVSKVRAAAVVIGTWAVWVAFVVGLAALE